MTTDTQTTQTPAIPTATDGLQGYDPSEIIVGPGGQTLEQAAGSETIDAIIAHLRATRPELVHFAGAMHRDPAARRVIEEYLLSPSTSGADLRERARTRRSPVDSHPGELGGLWRAASPATAYGAIIVARILGYDLDADQYAPERDITSPALPDLDAAISWVAVTADVARDRLVVHGHEIRVLGATACLAMYEVALSQEQPGARQEI